MVPAIRSDLSYTDNRQAFLKLLVEANTQRKKTAGMLLREAAMKVDPEQAYADLRKEQREGDNERRFGSGISDQQVDAKNIKGRKKISPASMPFLEAAYASSVCIKNSGRYRFVRLLGSIALKHASKPDSTY
jgi:hypothetical protein